MITHGGVIGVSIYQEQDCLPRSKWHVRVRPLVFHNPITFKNRQHFLEVSYGLSYLSEELRLKGCVTAQETFWHVCWRTRSSMCNADLEKERHQFLVNERQCQWLLRLGQTRKRKLARFASFRELRITGLSVWPASIRNHHVIQEKAHSLSQYYQSIHAPFINLRLATTKTSTSWKALPRPLLCYVFGRSV